MGGEQEKEWTKVLSKNQKCQLRSSPRKPSKRVHFAPKLVQNSPQIKHKPILQRSFKVGDVNVSAEQEVPIQRVFGRILLDLSPPCSPQKQRSVHANATESQENNRGRFSNFEFGHQRAELISCGNCLGLGHSSHDCANPIRCRSCWRYGHRAKRCFFGSRYTAQWRPKCQSSSTDPKQGKLQQNPVTQAPPINSSSTPTPPPSTVQIPEPPAIPSPASSMAIFVCNPQPFLPDGAHIEHGWQRPARSRVALGGEPPRRHEEYAIVTLHPAAPEHLVPAALQAVVQHFEHAFPVRVESSFRSPLGLGLYKFQSASQRQTLLDRSPLPFVNNSEIRVVKHDEARNFRACPYIRVCRVLILGFPLDYQTMEFFKAAVAAFGHLLSWHEGPNKSKSILDCLVLTTERIPRSIIVSRGSVMGGNGFW